MPEFVDVASHFDTTPTFDGYNPGVFLFNGQFSTFDESSPDGSIVKRRTMSVRPGTTMPPRKVINVVGETWIVGDGNSDGFNGVIVRNAYWLKKATDFIQVLTPAEAISGAPGNSIYVHREYLKDTVNTNTDSEYDPFWDTHLSPTEEVLRGMFFNIEGTLLRVRTTHADLNGMRLASCDELDQDAIVTVDMLKNGSYDPIADRYTGEPVSYPGIVMDMYKLYKYRTNMDNRNHSGDMTLLMEDNVVINVGDKLTIGTQPWQVLSKARELDAWSMQIRRQ